jgi:hypothetical protein
MFHAQYLNSSSLGFLQEDYYLSFYFLHIRKINDPPRVGPILIQGFFVLTNLVDTY